MSKKVTKLSWNQVEGIFQSIFSLEPKEFSKVEIIFLAIAIEKLLEFPLMIKTPDYQKQFSDNRIDSSNGDQRTRQIECKH